jgi:hypothetical protein
MSSSTLTADRPRGSVADHPLALPALIAGFTLLRLVLAAWVPLLPQEAYYWHWSRHLDWSYFDHPPLASYSIALTTALFGSTAFGIKSAAVLWAFGWNLLWARLVLDMFADRRLAFWSLLALNLTVAYEIFGVGPTPDGPLLFGWVGTVWATWRACDRDDGRWWFAAGAFAGLALLGKYAAVLLLPVVAGHLLLSPAHRHWLRRPQPYLAAGLAALIFAPVIYWNWQHDWASFAFQGTRRVGQMDRFRPHHLLALFGTQLLMATPYLLWLALAAFAGGVRDVFARRLGERERLLLIAGAVPLLVFTAVSLRSLVKINWLAPAYWPLIVLGVAAVLARGGLRGLKIGLASSALLVAALFAAALVPDLPIARDLNTWSGWRETAARVEHVERTLRARGEKTFVFAPNYKISSLLRFYLAGQPRTYAQDIYGAPALQYDYFPLDGDLKGATGILVTSDQDQGRLDLRRLAPYCASVERADAVETHAFGRLTRRAEIWLCRGYRGHPRLDPARTPGRGGPEPESD